ncbi:MAG: tetratricopeptide repeat protein [Tagaea sp.]
MSEPASERRFKRRDREREEALARLTTLAGTAPVAETAVLGAGAAAALAWQWFDLAMDRIGPLEIALGHMAVCLALALWLWTVAKRKRDLRLPWSLLGATATLGPLGALGTALSAALFAIFRRRTLGFEAWYAALFPEAKTEEARALFQEIVAGGDDDETAQRSVASFADVLAFGAFEQKQGMLALIAAYFRPAFAPALKAALAHTEPAIRVQAATAVAQIEARFLRRSVDLDKEMRRRPDDFALIFAAARHFDDYAFTGLLDTDRQDENRKRALALYARALTLKPDDSKVELALGRLLVRLGRHAEAVAILARAEKAGRLPADGAIWLLECFYTLRDYAALRAVASRVAPELEKAETADTAVRDAAKFWALGAAA